MYENVQQQQNKEEEMSWKSIKNMKTTTTRKSNVRKCSQKKRKKCNEKVSKTWNIEEEKTLNTLNNENNNNNKMYVNVHKKRSLAMIYCLFRACVDNFGRPRFRFCPIGMVLAAVGFYFFKFFGEFLHLRNEMLY